MTLSIDTVAHGTRVDYGRDDFYNSFPVSTPTLNNTGIYAQGLDLIDTQKYALDIFHDFKTWKAEEYPLLTLLANITGKLIHQNIIPWTDQYDSTSSIDVPFEHLRSRDHMGASDTTYASVGTASTATNVPFPIGNTYEMGGQLIWQKSFKGTSATSVFHMNALDTLAAGNYLWIPSFEAADNLLEVQTSRNINLREWPIMANTSGNKKLMTLAFHRSNLLTKRYNTTSGIINEVIRKIDNVLAMRNYTPIHTAGLTGDGGAGISVYTCYGQDFDQVGDPAAAGTAHVNDWGAETFYGYTYTTNSSKRAHIAFETMYTADIDTTGAVVYDQKVHVLVGVDAFFYNAAANTFILTLDFEDSNYYHITVASNATTDGTTALTTGAAPRVGYYVISGGTCDATHAFWAGSNADLAIDSTSFALGEIFHADGTDTATFLGTLTTNIFVKQVYDAVLLEEVNTAQNTSTAAVTDRIFGANGGASYGGGSTNIARTLIINRHKDVPSRVGETQAFDLTRQQGTYNFNHEAHFNYMQYFMSDPWSVSNVALATKYKINYNDIQISRQRHLETYKKDVMNALLWGKKSMYAPTVSAYNEGWSATCSGLFDYELFPIKYVYMPMPMSGNLLYTTDGGYYFETWMENLAKSLHYNKTPGTYPEITLFVSKTILGLLRKANARLGSGAYSTAGNALGATFQMVPPSKMTLGIPVYKYDSIEGVVNFVHEPALDFDTTWNVPRFLFPNTSGKLIPRYVAIAIDKSFIEFYTHAGRTEKIWGNLQPNNQVNVVTEGIQGSHSIVVRAPRNHAIVYMPPGA